MDCQTCFGYHEVSKSLSEALGMRFVEIQYDSFTPNKSDYAWSSDQSKYGKLGGRASYDKKTAEEQSNWHVAGGRRTAGRNRNIGKGSMSAKGAKNIKEARMRSKRWACPHGCVGRCGGTEFDGGNFTKHMRFVHNWTDEQIASAKVEA